VTQTPKRNKKKKKKKKKKTGGRTTTTKKKTGVHRGVAPQPIRKGGGGKGGVRGWWGKTPWPGRDKKNVWETGAKTIAKKNRRKTPPGLMTLRHQKRMGKKQKKQKKKTKKKKQTGPLKGKKLVKKCPPGNPPTP